MSSALGAHVDDYLRLRRALGFKLKEDGHLLGQFTSGWTPGPHQPDHCAVSAAHVLDL